MGEDGGRREGGVGEREEQENLTKSAEERPRSRKEGGGVRDPERGECFKEEAEAAMLSAAHGPRKMVLDKWPLETFGDLDKGRGCPWRVWREKTG